MLDIQELAKRLPSEAQHELLDFALFLYQKYSADEDKSHLDFWLRVSDTTLASIWNNEEDDVYGELL